MKSRVLTALLLCILAAACQKRKYPEEKVTLGPEPLYFNGSVDGEAIDLKIGTNGYYCYSSYSQSSDSVYIFKADLRKYDCNPCPMSLQLELADLKPRLPGSQIPVDSSFRIGSRRLMPDINNPAKIYFSAACNKQVTSLRWDFTGGYTTSDPVMDFEFLQPGLQTVSLTVRTVGNCESVAENKIFVGGSTKIFACFISSGDLQGNSVKFRANITGGVAPYTYSWNFGDGSSSNLEWPAHSYAWSGSYPVKLTVKDNEGNVCESNFIHIAGNDQSSCAANIVLSRNGGRTELLNSVRLQWVDRSNSVLRSDAVKQPAGSYFEITGSEPFGTNEKGERGWLLTLRYNVLLTDGTKIVWIKSEKTAMAVGYK